MEVGGQRNAPVDLPPGKAGAHCRGGWVGPTAGVNGKSRPPLRFDPQSVQARSELLYY